MATFWATFSNVDNRARSGGTLPVMMGRGAVGLEPLTTSGTSQIVQFNSADWTSARSGNVTIQCGSAVWVMVAAAPTAIKGVVSTTDGVDFYLAANERLELTVQTGDKIAVVDA